MSRVAVVGAGAWGTALALQAVRSGNNVDLVCRDSASAAAMKDRRENYRLPGFHLPDQLAIRADIPDDAAVLLWAVPTQHLRASLRRLQPLDKALVVCAKGVEAETLMLPLEVVQATTPACHLAVLTGPNFAAEIAAGLPAAAVVASEHADLRERVQLLLGTPTFRLYGNDDPIGAQVGGAAKNVIAIAAGAVVGAGLGENARAALVTRGLRELCRLDGLNGGRPETVTGLSGLGDLLLTCTGASSRNFSLGHALGRGENLLQILAEKSAVIEGVATAAALVARAGEVELPICSAVADLLAGTQSLTETIAKLLARPLRDE